MQGRLANGTVPILLSAFPIFSFFSSLFSASSFSHYPAKLHLLSLLLLPYSSNSIRTLPPLCIVWRPSGIRGNSSHSLQWWYRQLRKRLPNKSRCGFRSVGQDLMKIFAWLGATWHISNKPQKPEALKRPHSLWLPSLQLSCSAAAQWGPLLLVR